MRPLRILSCAAALGAALPVAAQPGPVITIASGVVDHDVAYDPSNDLFLVVWSEAMRVRGQRMRIDGTLVGPPIEIASLRSGGVAVANVASRGKFVVARIRDLDVEARTVDAATGALGTVVTLPRPPLGGSTSVDVGGDDRSDAARVQFAYGLQFLASCLEVVQAEVTAGGDLELEPFFLTVQANAGNVEPSVSDAPGSDGRYLVAYEIGSGSFQAVVVDANSVTEPAQFSALSTRFSQPAVAGDDMGWTVVYVRQQVPAPSELFCQRVTARPGTEPPEPGAATRVTSTPTQDSWPTLAWVGDSYVLAQLTVGVPPDTQLMASTLDVFRCSPCEPSIELDLDPTRSIGRVASAHGAPGTEQALIVWDSIGAPANLLRAASLEARDGIVTDLGGGCASGGSARATCARAGNLDFTHRLRAAAPATPALLLLGTTRLDLACGPCTVVPLPLVALDAGATDAVGNASLRMPLPANPSLVGALLYEQWLVASAGACPLLQSSLSNALSVQIQ